MAIRTFKLVAHCLSNSLTIGNALFSTFDLLFPGKPVFRTRLATVTLANQIPLRDPGPGKLAYRVSKQGDTQSSRVRIRCWEGGMRTTSQGAIGAWFWLLLARFLVTCLELIVIEY